jgi:putative oxidoreductase
MNTDGSKNWFAAHLDQVVDVVRIYLGIALFFKGIFFITHRDHLLNLLDESGTLWIAPTILMHYIVPAHLLGGMLLAIGLLTRAAAIAQIPILLGAVFHVFLPKVMLYEPRQNFEFAALVLFLLIVVAFYGPGRWSVDYLLNKQAVEEKLPATQRST